MASVFFGLILLFFWNYKTTIRKGWSAKFALPATFQHRGIKDFG